MRGSSSSIAFEKGDLADLSPRDMIDIQSFSWVLCSNEYVSGDEAVVQTVKSPRPSLSTSSFRNPKSEPSTNNH